MGIVQVRRHGPGHRFHFMMLYHEDVPEVTGSFEVLSVTANRYG